MRRIKLIVAYDGTEYSGWQIQPEAPTIEMYLDKAIRELTGENVHVTGASRTDAGVHAYGNVAVFATESTIPGDRFTFALNRFLPDSIVIQDSWEVSVDFHPRHCDTRKTYEYRILNTAVPLPQKRNFTWHVAGSIDIEKMKLSQLDIRKNLHTQYLNAVNYLMNNQRNFKKQKDNYLLAEEVYAVTTDRYREGITSMTEVLQDEMRMSEAQNNYISAHYNYRVTNLMLLKLTGQIASLFK